MSEAIINKIHTPCFECYFNTTKGKVQTGCKLDLISKYGDNVLSVVDQVNNEFFVINNRSCNFKRSPEWGAGLTVGEARIKAKKELEPKIDLVIYTNKWIPKQITKTIKSAIAQKVTISNITIVNHTGNIDLVNEISSTVIPFGKTWKIKSVIEDGATKDRAMDLAIKESPFPFFLNCEAGYKIPKVLQKFHEAINCNVQQISCIGLGSLDPPEALLGQTLLYKMLQGNAGDYTFWQKLIELEKEEKSSLVKRESDL